MKLRLMTKNVLATAKISFLAGIFITYSSCQKESTNVQRVLDKSYKESIIKGREVIKTYMITNFTPGLSVSVSHNNKTVWSEGYGLASKELKVPAGRDTKYRIGNTTQMFTAFIMAKLQEEGKLDINDSFYDYIPEFPKKQKEFTVKQLGVNAAGFRPDHPSLLLNKNDFKTLKEYISYFENDSLAYNPGTYFEESMYSISLMGLLAEELSGKHYSKLIQESILDTLHLDNTRIDNPFAIIENRSDYYYLDYVARQINAPNVDMRYIVPAHGVISTADDLNKAGQAVLKPGFFKQESLDLFFTPFSLETGYQTNRGFGWWISAEKDRKAYVQLGSTIGGSSILVVYPEENLVISVCSNIEDKNSEFPAMKIANLFLDQIDAK